jgi:hypothetical protein
MAKRGDLDRKDVDPVVEVRAEQVPADEALRSTFAAVIRRTSTGIVVVPPTRMTCCASSTRSSLLCTLIGTSPMSSRKRVPVWASSNRPFFSLGAVVKAPRSCPNSSGSSRSCGMAEREILMSGRSLRVLTRWMWSANSSLPTPVSPIWRTEVSERASVSMRVRMSRMRSLFVTMAMDGRPSLDFGRIPGAF